MYVYSRLPANLNIENSISIYLGYRLFSPRSKNISIFYNLRDRSPQVSVKTTGEQYDHIYHIMIFI